MAFLLEHMAETGETISALAARLPRFYRKSGTVAYEHGRLGSLMQALEESFPGVETDRSDGLKLILPGCLDPRARLQYRAAAPHGRRGPLGSRSGRVVRARPGAVWCVVGQASWPGLLACRLGMDNFLNNYRSVSSRAATTGDSNLENYGSGPTVFQRPG
jgi:hypothetical protein